MRAAGPTADPIPCSACGKLIDPLRAGHVAIFDQKLHYFCDVRLCRAAFLAPFGDEPARDATPPPVSKTPPAEHVGAIERAHAPVVPDDVLPDLPDLDDERGFVEAIGRRTPEAAPPRAEAPATERDVGALLLLIAVVAGTLAVLLGLTGGGKLLLLARVLLAAVGVGMLAARAATTPPDASDPHALPLLAPPLGAIAVAAWATLRSPASIAGEAASLAGTIVTATAVGAWLLEAARREVTAERAWVEASLTIPGRRVTVTGFEEGILDLRPGERVMVQAGEDVPVDLTIAEGEAEVLPWPGATATARRRPGDPIVAGAHVVRGKIVGVCTWGGADRAFARLVLDPRRRVDALAPVARAARSLAERWSAAAAAAAGLLAFAITRSPIDAAMTFVASHAGLSTAMVGSLASVYVARGLLAAQRRGITYKSADAWDRAGRATTAVFCARGTLLLGEPEVAEVEATAKDIDAGDVLSLASGAARAEQSPSAHAILRAASTRSVRPDPIRNPTVHPGLGVVAVTGTGEELCVGVRALLLEQRISIASAESRLAELEALGRSIVLVALGSRLVGLIALQDGIRPGARAAVQYLLDAQVEPGLMSGDSRETCDAIARSLDIEHTRPEVFPSERAEEVKRLAETGERVAVLGHADLDEAPLGAAQIAVALTAAGSATGDHDVALAGGDLRDAALALALAKRTHVEARVGFALAAIPPVLGVLVVAIGILPPAFIPIAALLGGVVGVVHGRAIRDRQSANEGALPRRATS
ncbi:MAG: HAD family hydrolase [Polyangiaceae bacterium]|nr:HAD family hydrolase [Polyangiaceae bacterium]